MANSCCCVFVVIIYHLCCLELFRRIVGLHLESLGDGPPHVPTVINETEGLIRDGKIHIGDNDLLKMHLLNSAIKMNVERGRGRLIKLNASAHIDGCAALADAFCVRQKWYGEIGEQLQNRG